MDVVNAVQRSDVVWLQQNTQNNVLLSEIRQTKSGDTLLHIASSIDCLPVMKWVLEHGCDVCMEHRNADGKTPLHCAAQTSLSNAVSLLLQHGAEVDALKRSDWTPLMLAATRSNTDVIQVLLSAGANLSLTNKDGWTALHIACREGCVTVVKELLVHDITETHTLSKNGRTPLHTAALNGHTSVVRLLVDAFGLYDCGDACGSTPLMEALRSGHLRTAQVLLDSGANLYHQDHLGRNALHLSAEAGENDVVTALVKIHGMDINATSNSGLTALHCAAREGHVEMVRLLVTLKANIDVLDHNGRTAMWLSCGGKKKECVRVLLELGAQDISDKNGVKPSYLMAL